MRTDTNVDHSHLSFWPRVREFAVPPGMIETATARRLAGDWAGACAAAGFDVDLDLRSTARTHGRELAAEIRSDLRHLVPDLLRWHLPRIAPDGLLRPGLTLTLARYERAGPRPGGANAVELVVRTAPAWADAGQRISLALCDGSAESVAAQLHPHPRPDRRYRLDLHRHLWDARRADELRIRSGAGARLPEPEVVALLPEPDRYAVACWATEARLLLAAEKRCASAFVVRLGGRRRLVLEVIGDGVDPPSVRLAPEYPAGAVSALPVLPDAATWTLPDLVLLRAGAITAGRLHPLVASALVSGGPEVAGQQREYSLSATHLVDCRGARHRIGLVDGVLSALDHDPAELRREELLAALSGTPVPCLRAIDAAHRAPDCLPGVQERLHHGDAAGALAVVEGLLGPQPRLRPGALLDELEAAAQRRIAYGLYRSGLSSVAPRRVPPNRDRRGDHRGHPRNATTR